MIFRQPYRRELDPEILYMRERAFAQEIADDLADMLKKNKRDPSYAPYMNPDNSGKKIRTVVLVSEPDVIFLLPIWKRYPWRFIYFKTYETGRFGLKAQAKLDLSESINEDYWKHHRRNRPFLHFPLTINYYREAFVWNKPDLALHVLANG